MYTRSNIWEGLFIDVSGHNLHRPITIGNIYRTPHNNNNNANIEEFGSKTIADKFNEYFTKIGPELASSINPSHKIPFNDYLKPPCQLSFQFQYTIPDNIEKIIGDLNPNTAPATITYIVSSKLLKDIKMFLWIAKECASQISPRIGSCYTQLDGR